MVWSGNGAPEDARWSLLLSAVMKDSAHSIHLSTTYHLRTFLGTSISVIYARNHLDVSNSHQ